VTQKPQKEAACAGLGLQRHGEKSSRYEQKHVFIFL
jgi:hypothetical protein